MGLICLKLGTLTRNYPIVRNTKENYDLQAEFRNYEANMAKITKIGENAISEKRRKTHLLHQKSSVWAKNHTRPAKPCYLEISATDFPFFDFSHNGGHF